MRYLGWVVSNKTEGVRDKYNYSGDKKSFVVLPKDEWVIVKNCHPKLKTEEQHELILREFKKRRTSFGNNNNINALSGLVKCHYCNSTMILQRKENGDISIKKCKNCEHDNKGGDSALVTKAIRDIIEKLEDWLLNINYQDESLTKEKQKLLEEIRLLELEIDKDEAAIERIEDGYDDGVYTAEEARKRKKKRTDIKINNEEMLREKKKLLNNFSMTSNEERIKKVENFKKQINENNNPQKLNEIYKSLIDRIIWKRDDNDEIEVTVKLLQKVINNGLPCTRALDKI